MHICIYLNKKSNFPEKRSNLILHTWRQMPTNADQSCRIRVGREAVFIGSTVLAKLSQAACTQPDHMAAAVSKKDWRCIQTSAALCRVTTLTSRYILTHGQQHFVWSNTSLVSKRNSHSTGTRNLGRPRLLTSIYSSPVERQRPSCWYVYSILLGQSQG